MKSKSLPNELKEAIPPDVWLLPYLRAEQSGDPNELNQYWERLRELERRKFASLFKHYGIDPNSRPAWRLLATQLAREYVRGFQLADRPRGAPRKPKLPKTPSKPGALIKWSREHYELIIELHRKGEELLIKKNGGRITQVAALTAGLRWLAEHKGIPYTLAEIRKNACALARRLSEAKKHSGNPRNK